MILTIAFIFSVLVIFCFFMFWRYVFFIRLPKRTITLDENAILSPADGFICYIRKITPGEAVFSIKNDKKIFLDELMFTDNDKEMGKPGWLIGIMMTIFDVHYNTAPVTGFITKIKHDYPIKIGTNKSMLPTEINLLMNQKPYWKDAIYLPVNERASYIITNKVQSIYVTQIADKWVKKIMTMKNNQEIQQGDIFGMIKMGSQVDVFIPDEHGQYDVLVKERQKVKAGITKLLMKKNK